jgi:hypothetical protein
MWLAYYAFSSGPELPKPETQDRATRDSTASMKHDKLTGEGNDLEVL